MRGGQYPGDTGFTWQSVALNLGGGYAHRLPSIYSVPGPPRYGTLFSAEITNLTFFKDQLPGAGWPNYIITVRNQLDSVTGRWVLKSEQYYDIQYDAAQLYPGGYPFGDVWHTGGDGAPEGGALLYTDMSAVWGGSSYVMPYWTTGLVYIRLPL